MSDEISITPYSHEWPRLFQAEKASLRLALPADSVLRIEHIGSTAVAGLPAKPVIDIMLVVRSLEAARETFEAKLDALDYIYWAENPQKDRLFFVKGLPPFGKGRSHHIHVFEAGSAEIEKRMAFIELLRRNPAVRRAYEALKRELAVAHRADREAYTDAKSLFIHKHLKELEAI